MIDRSTYLKIKNNYNSLARARYNWIKKNKFYHDQILKYYSFIIPAGSRILEFGCSIGYTIGNLKPSYGVGVDFSEEIIKIAKKKYPKVKFVCSDYEKFNINQKFDYIILSGVLSITQNLQEFLQSIRKFCNPETRIVIYEYNRMWSSFLRIFEKLGLKMPETKINELAVKDIENIININGYQLIKKEKFGMMPAYFPLLSVFFNKVLGKLPFLENLSINQFLVFRLNEPGNAKTVSVVLTCRDEEGNIEKLVKRIPNLGKHTEIIFVEGHSKDNTYQKIKEMIRKYPKKDIKLLKQKGIGQKDAIYMGFNHAKGDFIILLESDLTTPPEEILYVWDVYKKGLGEYVQGTRFVYKMNREAMPMLNRFGNKQFAKLFSWVFGQRFTDTLSGVKALSRKRYKQFDEQKDFFKNLDPFGDFEMIFWAMKSNLKLVEVPITYVPRSYGETKTRAYTHGWSLIKIAFKAMKLFKFRV